MALDAVGRGLCRFLQISQHLFGMALRLYLFEDVLNLAVGSNDKGRPRYAPDFLAVHVLLLHDCEGLGYLLVGVGQQGEGKAFLLGELFLRFWSIRGDAEQHGARFLNLSVGVAEPARFYRSTRGVRLRIEEEYDDLAAQVLQRNVFSVLVLQSKVGRFIMNIHGIFSRDIKIEIQ